MTRAAESELLDWPVVDNPWSLNEALGGQRALLLSATVPRRIEGEEGIERLGGETLDELNVKFGSAVRADRIRDAAAAMTRTALNYGYRLVCRAHPSVTPMLLQAASDMDARPGSVVVFESQINLQGQMKPTMALCNWSSGRLVVTQIASRSGRGTRFDSLAFMRELMMKVTGLNAAVFIGGHGEVALDALAFEATHPNSKSYAVESTGSAAELLARRSNTPLGFQGGLNASTLRDSRSYSLVAHRIMVDITRGGRP